MAVCALRTGRFRSVDAKRRTAGACTRPFGKPSSPRAAWRAREHLSQRTLK